MEKRQRSYNLFIGPPIVNGAPIGDTIEITSPTTIEFDVQRNDLATSNRATITLYNLSKNTRNKIFKDSYRWDIKQDVQLNAGYGAERPTIFKGHILRAYSVRHGVNYITTIDAQDSGETMLRSQVSTTVPAGATRKQLLETIIQGLPNVTTGAIGSYNDVLKKPTVLNGNAADLLKVYSENGFFIDLGKAYCLNDSDCITGPFDTITSDSGLLGSPTREGTKLDIDIIFEPRIIIGQLINLQSRTEDNFNGPRKVMSISHRGTISDAVCGDAVTHIGMWAGLSSLKKVG